MNYGFQSSSPVILSTSVNVPASSNVSGSGQDLAYPFRKAIIIEEIHWDMSMTTPTGQPISPNMGAYVSTKLQLGQHYLMRDPVPVWSLCPLIGLIREQNGTGTNLDAFSHYKWRLPKPLYVEAGQWLQSQFIRGNDTLNTINVTVSYVGRVAPPSMPRPGVISVPYAAPYQTTVGNTYGQSNEYNLFNPFDFPLDIHRFTGRMLDTTLFEQIGSVTLVPPNSGPTVQIYDSFGGKMVNNFTGIGDVFDVPRASWTVNTQLPAKSQYEVQVWNLPTTQQAHFAIIGSRDEAI